MCMWLRHIVFTCSRLVLLCARSECSSDGNFDFFTKQMSASCGSNGLITDHDTCDKARTALGLAATSVTWLSTSSYPYGCIFSNHGSYVHLNTYNYYRAYGYNGMSCLCKNRIPVCTWQGGSAAHNTSGQCACGTTTCSAKTGMTCIAANSTCRDAFPYEFAQGVRENSDVCGCGTVDCTESTGCFVRATPVTQQSAAVMAILISSSKRHAAVMAALWFKNGLITDHDTCDKARTARICCHISDMAFHLFLSLRLHLQQPWL